MSLFPFLPSAMVVQRPAAAAFKAGRLCLPLNDTRLDHTLYEEVKDMYK